MTNFITKTVRSFKYAFAGLMIMVKERNFTVHILATVCALATMYFLELDRYEIIIIVLLISNVLSAETMNTAIEKIVVQNKKLGLSYEEAGEPLDIAAGAVLISAVLSVIAGFLVIGPSLIDAIQKLLG